MNKLTIIAFTLVTLLSSCKQYVQIYEVKSSNVKKESKTYIYENDSIKITYDFWIERGLVNFNIFNKQNIPLYIDWRKSSFVDNVVKLDYWQEETNTSAINSGYYFHTPITAYNNSKSKSTSIKKERITFIPPNSQFSKKDFYILLKDDFYLLDTNCNVKTEKRNNNKKKETTVYEKEYSLEDSPFVFRNFLTYSFSEDFKEEYYIDNQFYVNKIQEIDIRHFQSLNVKKETMTYYYKDSTKFYLKILDSYKSVAKRKRTLWKL